MFFLLFTYMQEAFLGSSVVERLVVNQMVVGSIPTRGVCSDGGANWYFFLRNPQFAFVPQSIINAGGVRHGSFW